jgi:hypothetical protein
MNQERARVDVLHPTLCDETAKDGAPERWRDVVSEMRLVCGVRSCFARYPHLKIEIWAPGSVAGSTIYIPPFAMRLQRMGHPSVGGE